MRMSLAEAEGVVHRLVLIFRSIPVNARPFHKTSFSTLRSFRWSTTAFRSPSGIRTAHQDTRRSGGVPGGFTRHKTDPHATDAIPNGRRGWFARPAGPMPKYRSSAGNVAARLYDIELRSAKSGSRRRPARHDRYPVHQFAPTFCSPIRW